MKKTQKIIRLILFIIVYTLSCLMMTSDRLGPIMGYTTTINLLIKFAVIFLSVLICTIINKDNAQLLNQYSAAATNVILIAFIIDNYFTHISGSVIGYRLWWLCAIFIANAALYAGVSICRIDNFHKFSRSFQLSFLPTYLFSMILIFARKPNSYFEVNLQPGKGLISYLGYLINNLSYDSWTLFNFVGNLVFFIPMPFMAKALFKKANGIQLFAICAVIPFLIEGYQYIFKCGSVDIDDIIFNLSGLILGIIMINIEKRIQTKKAGL